MVMTYSRLTFVVMQFRWRPRPKIGNGSFSFCSVRGAEKAVDVQLAQISQVIGSDAQTRSSNEQTRSAQGGIVIHDDMA